jgi:vacuolar-type H+-ATPase subunit I/STV1
MEDICIKNMNKLTISFIILVGLLFVGIVILIYPTSFAPRLTTSQMSPPTQPLAGTIVPREIIMIGSALTITGLVGLAILGFRIFKESEHGEIRK